MTFIKSLYRTTDAQLMLLTDQDTGLPLKNEDGDEMGLMLTTIKSPACKKIRAKYRNKHRDRAPTAAEEDQAGIDLLTAATVGFHNLQLEEGKGVVDFDENIARDMYENSDVIFKQVNKYLGADENFLKSVLAA